MISFAEFLIESNAEPLLNESVTFLRDSNTTMISNLDDFEKWYRYAHSGAAYTTDGKYSFTRSRSSNTLGVYETGSYGKSGNSNSYDIRIKKEVDSNGEFISAITSIDGIMDVAKDFEKKGLVDIYTSSIKNLSASAFTPVLLKNFKSVGSVAKSAKITKAQARKIVASGDFHSISHKYQMMDDNYNSSGDLNMTYAIIKDILSDLDSKHTVVLNTVGSESFSISVHSNLTYYVNR